VLLGLIALASTACNNGSDTDMSYKAAINDPYLSTDPPLNDPRREPEVDQTLNTARQRHEAFKRAFFK
jgi:hypothetical protein